MDIRVLRYFLAVAQERTISRAATTLHLSQPTLSRQLSDLEAELGVRLFTRGSREITLTAAGRYLQERATTITRLVDKTAQNLQTTAPIIRGSLDIGAGESRGMQRLMALISRLQADYPGVTLHLHSGDAATVAAQLTAGTLDFGVIMGDSPLTHYHALQLPERDRWGILLPKTAPLAQQTTIRPQDLVGHPLIVSQQAATTDRFANWWRNVADQLTLSGTYNLIFNAQLLVEQGHCWALSFDHLVDVGPESRLTFRPLAPDLTEPITVIWSRQQTLSPVAQLFLHRLRANLGTPE
ncbi:LysR family transcriptional regulator [Levilactobacillus spicheri]|uniref:Transcriptional regulator n=2 Tax=Levilactobacillus spicheri TaxID=216463 RepID=A0ABQ0WRJ2_9LACO|nr:LysR family transcriptional regulator [Levilactobacillus spicheri]KRL48536.1 transcriptional regulator [Levilactobacillus spicheri DSM 15429]GEO67742.1 transcriptional regulator [Levilactobacillus spicheri]